MKSEKDIISTLTERLPTALGGRYEVKRETGPTSITGGSPDIVIYNQQTERYIIIEVIGSPHTDLPLATLLMVRRLKKLHERLDPDLVLVSLSRVPSRLKSQFATERVKVIEFEDENKLVSDLLEVAKVGKKTPRPKPDYPEVWLEQGSELANLGQYQEALEAYDRAINLRPDDPQAWYNKGNTLYDLGRYEEAIEAYDQAISFRPDYPQAWYNKGAALGALGRYEEAIEWLCRAWRAWEQLPDNRVLVAEVLRELGHNPEECAPQQRGKGFFRRLFWH